MKKLNPLVAFDAALTTTERKQLAQLKTPAKIQAYLDALPYSAEDRYRCPLSVLRDQRAHCFDGAMFAAALLQRCGYPPLLIDLFAERDDDHVLAVYKQAEHWGAIAKSNFVGLRYREPIYRTVRELALSYFNDYFNIEKLKTLRSYTLPLNLRPFERFNWLSDDEACERIAAKLDAIRRVPLLTPRMAARLLPVDQRTYEAGLLGSNAAGLWKPS